MKISVLTTITNPDDRQDCWHEALQCYSAFADEVIVVDGSNGATAWGIGKVRFVPMVWPYDWHWVELPRHLNYGLWHCTGDWIFKLDIDQLIHENDFAEIRRHLEIVPDTYDVVTMQKMTLLYGRKYYQKGGQPIAFRKKDYIKIGKNLDYETDLCYPVLATGVERIGGYDLPIGHKLLTAKIPLNYWNYDYFFKTKDFTKKEFWRFSQAYHRYFKVWKFGGSEEDSFKKFLENMKNRHDRAPYTYDIEDHPKFIREQIEELNSHQFGYNGWGLI